MWYCIPKQETIIAPRDIEIDGILHPAAIFTAWSKEDLAAIGIVPYREDNWSPAWTRPVEWSESLEDGEWVRRAMVWEPIPAPAPITLIPKAVWLARLTPEEKKLIWSLAATNSFVAEVVTQMTVAWTEVDVADPSTETLLRTLADLGVFRAVTDNPIEARLPALLAPLEV